MAKTKLTPKQAVFVKEYVKTKNATKAALVAYDTEDYKTAQNIGSVNLSNPIIRTKTEQLFNLEDTQLIVQNLKKLAISAESQETQVKATKEWLDRAVPKTESNASLNFTQINNNLGSKYAD